MGLLSVNVVLFVEMWLLSAWRCDPFCGDVVAQWRCRPFCGDVVAQWRYGSSIGDVVARWRCGPFSGDVVAQWSWLLNGDVVPVVEMWFI